MMWIKLCVVISCAVAVLAGINDIRSTPPTPTEMIRSEGYKAEEHQVVTPDGYILTLHRIPEGRYSSFDQSNEVETTPKKVVFIQHGLVSSSADWVINGPGKALAYVMADAGYDVWLGNFRGNTYSKRHNHLNPRDRDFWNFEWHELGTIDLPSMIDYVLRITGEKKLQYIGHSQGTTTFLVMTSEKPEYNDKITSAHLLAPIGYMSNLKSPFVRAISTTAALTMMDVTTALLGGGEFMPSTRLNELGGKLLCRDKAVTQSLCENSFFLLAGFDSENMNETLIPDIMKRYPAGSSVYQLIHYAQEVHSGRFCKYDHGFIKNQRVYGARIPPEYNLQKVSAKVALYYGQNDWLAAVEDVQKLRDRLPNVVVDYEVPFRKWNHIDFLWGINAKQVVYDKVIQNMKNYV